MELTSLLVGIAMLILLAVTSMRYGADSRDGFRAKRGELAPLGIISDIPSATRHPLPPAKGKVQDDLLPQPTVECALIPCAA